MADSVNHGSCFWFSQLEIKRVMVGATGVECGLADRTTIATGEIIGDAECAVAIAAKYGPGFPLLLAPNNGRMTSRFVVALDASVKGPAAFKPNADNVALGVIMGALGALIHANAVADNGCWGPHGWLRNQNVLLAAHRLPCSAGG